LGRGWDWDEIFIRWHGLFLGRPVFEADKIALGCRRVLGIRLKVGRMGDLVVGDFKIEAPLPRLLTALRALGAIGNADFAALRFGNAAGYKIENRAD
jgi:hypothetical protein